VVGGVFIKMLTEPALWKKWAGRDKAAVGNWAPLPKPPQVKAVVPTAQKEAVAWRYTLAKPAENWFKPEFDASAWKEGPGGFGSPGTPGAVVRTEWKSADIWLRREFTMPDGDFQNLQLLLHHDEDAEVYVNGVLAATAGGYTAEYEPVAISPDALKALKPGKNTFAMHCHQTKGGQYADVGIVDVKE
jgi:hypothetical protein